MTPELPELMACILRWLVDAAYLSHRLLILDVLGHLARSTSYVVAPYSEFPTLMPILFDIVKNDKSPDICHEVCSNADTRRRFFELMHVKVTRVLGILGALDPWQQNRHLIQIQAQEEKQATTAVQKEAKQSSSQHNIGTEEFNQVALFTRYLGGADALPGAGLAGAAGHCSGPRARAAARQGHHLLLHHCAQVRAQPRAVSVQGTSRNARRHWPKRLCRWFRPVYR